MQSCSFRLLVLIAFLVALSPAVGAETARLSVLTWIFSIHNDNEGMPHGKVFLQVNKKRVLVEADARVHYQTLRRDEYSDRHIPASALTACTGWYAGGGEDMYVIRRGNRLQVFRRWEEEHEAIQPYHILRSLPLLESRK